MRRLAFGLSLALLCPMAAAADKTAGLREPTASAEKAPLPPLAKELKDPTQMNQNFREALERTSQTVPNTAAPSLGKDQAPKTAVLSKIALLANVWNGQKNKNAALLRVGDRSGMVYIGDTVSAFEDEQLLEIHILDIQKNYVKVRVLPLNATIILR